MNSIFGPWQAEMSLATRAAEDAARLLRDQFSRDPGVRKDSEKDIKTEADLKAEEVILKLLHPSGLPIVAEESATKVKPGPGPCWLVDPLDGTLNFVRGFPATAVSIALWEGESPQFGVIVDLARDRVFRGVVKSGAWCGDVPIRVSTVKERRQAVLATGFPSQTDYTDQALTTFIRRVQRFKKIRMVGSAALSLAMVACGVFDAYIEEGIKLWDVAAGIALVKAAGGQAEFASGRLPWSLNVKATNGWVDE